MRASVAGRAWGTVFVLLGVVFLLESLDVLRLRAGAVWPLLLIGLGAALLAGGATRRSPSPEAEERHREPGD